MGCDDEEMQFDLGGSMEVANVQELAKQHLTNLPLRYIRHHHHHHLSSSSLVAVKEIPVIDMHKLLLPKEEEEERLRLHLASKEWGFFQIVNHGVPVGVVEGMKSEVEAFFKLPLEKKNKVGQEAGNAEGYGHTFISSQEQKLDWSDAFFLTTNPSHLRKPRIFDNLPLSLREALERYVMEVGKLAMTILEHLAGALGVEVGEMRELFEDGYEGLRMNYYPPCPQPHLVDGAHPHSDSTGLTILLQVNDVQGLQVRHRSTWIPVTPLPNAFVVNIGDIMEMISNGVYQSIEHKGVVNSVKERISVASFFNPKLTAEFGPSRNLTSPQNPPLFKTITTENFFKNIFDQNIESKSYLDQMRIQSGYNYKENN